MMKTVLFFAMSLTAIGSSHGIEREEHTSPMSSVRAQNLPIQNKPISLATFKQSSYETGTSPQFFFLPQNPADLIERQPEEDTRQEIPTSPRSKKNMLQATSALKPFYIRQRPPVSDDEISTFFA